MEWAEVMATLSSRAAVEIDHLFKRGNWLLAVSWGSEIAVHFVLEADNGGAGVLGTWYSSLRLCPIFCL